VLKDRELTLMLVLALVLGSFIGLIMFIQSLTGRDDYGALIKMSAQSYFIGCYRASNRSIDDINRCKELAEMYKKEIEIAN